MLKAFLRSPVAPWTGVVAGPVAWLVMHQGLGNAIYFDCRLGNPGAAMGVGLACLLILALGGWLSWQARRSPSHNPEPQARFFLSIVSMLLCALFAVVVVLQVLAGLILPGCYA